MEDDMNVPHAPRHRALSSNEYANYLLTGRCPNCDDIDIIRILPAPRTFPSGPATLCRCAFCGAHWTEHYKMAFVDSFYIIKPE